MSLFEKITNSRFEKFIDSYYADDVISQSTDLLLLFTGVFEGLKGNPELNLKNKERSDKKEIKKIKQFNDDITKPFEELILNKIELMYPKESAKIIMGDNYENITNSTIVNRSLFIEILEKECNNKQRNSLIELKKIVENSGNQDAIGLYNDFLEELSVEQPKKRKLKSYWNSIIDTLPKIKDLTDITVGITSLFS